MKIEERIEEHFRQKLSLFCKCKFTFSKFSKAFTTPLSQSFFDIATWHNLTREAKQTDLMSKQDGLKQ